MSDKTKDPIEDIFNDDSTKPESNWFAFEKVGDTIYGKLVEVKENHKTKFGDQTVYVVEKPDGTIVNVPLKNTTHKLNIDQLKRAALGDTIAIRFSKEVDTGKSNPAKSLEVRIRSAIK